jgi:hypothetical protein
MKAIVPSEQFEIDLVFSGYPCQVGTGNLAMIAYIGDSDDLLTTPDAVIVDFPMRVPLVPN